MGGAYQSLSHVRRRLCVVTANIYYMEEQALWELWHDFLGDLA